MAHKTTLIVAHRLTSIVDSDVIMVLHQGRLTESGTHEQLMNYGRVYRMLWDQMTREDGSGVTPRL
jgi:ATP-binding cassette subfamily B protein